jgi:CHAT domain-containing protein/tetratricopeptide (TPR) repeat protein
MREEMCTCERTKRRNSFDRHRLGTHLAFSTACVLGIVVLSVSATSAQTPGAFRDLSAGHPAAMSLTTGSVTGVRMDLRGCEAVEILLQVAEPDIEFRIVSNDGAEIQSGRSLTAGWIAIPLATSGRQQLLLQLSKSTPALDQNPARARVDMLQIPAASLRTRTEAAQTYSIAQSLHASLRGEDVQQAIVKYREAAFAWGGVNDRYAQAIALGGEAESLFELSRYTMAAQTLDDAISLDTKNIYVHAWLAHLKARVFLDEWESPDAQSNAEISFDLGKSIDEPALIADALADQAEALFLTSGTNADSDAAEALSIARSSGLPETGARALRCEAWIEQDEGHLSRALSLMTEAEANFRRAGDLRLAVEATEDITSIESREGDKNGALIRYLKLKPLSEDAGNLVDFGILLENIGNEYAALNRLRLARLQYQMAEAAYARIPFRSGESLVRGRMCALELRSADLRGARRDCSISAAIAEQIHDPNRIAVSQFQLGQVYQASGELGHALDYFRRAAKISDSVHDTRWAAQERIGMGEVLEKQKRNQESLADFDQAFSLSHDAEDKAGQLEAQYRIARWYVVNGQFEKASQALEPALNEIEATRRSVSNDILQASYFAAERKCYQLAVDLRMGEYGRDRSSRGDAMALEMSENGRARSLLDALRARTEAYASGSRDTQANLIRSNMAVNKAFDQRLKLLLVGGPRHELDVNAAQLAQAVDSLERAEDDARAFANPVNQSASTLTAAEIETASETSDASYFEYALGSAHSYLWVVDRGVLKSYVLPPRDQIESMVRRWRAFLASGGTASSPRRPGEQTGDLDSGFQRLSAKLSCTLLGDAVETRMTRLIIVPDGDLAMLPFTALPENACNSARGDPLVERHEVILTPSLSVFLSRKAPSEIEQFKGEVAIVADPVFDPGDSRTAILKSSGTRRAPSKPQSLDSYATLPRLLNTRLEAASIQQAVGHEQAFVALGFDANLQTLMSPAMQDYRIWHLATHGVYDETTPEFSGLVFSLVSPDGSPTYGFLKAHDIAYMQLRPELVVLNACNSAAGENLSGEGVMGLSYSFLRAGVKHVISTLWNIDDTVSRQLMVTFYQEMMRNGNDAAAALRQSQLVVMRQRHSSDPYYWAGFELTSVGN